VIPKKKSPSIDDALVSVATSEQGMLLGKTNTSRRERSYLGHLGT
jgi:hypothetical protein